MRKKGADIKNIYDRLLRADAYNLEDSYNLLNTKCVNPYKGRYPCRSCSNCLASRADFWGNRMMVEYNRADYAHVCTLTFSEPMAEFGLCPGMVGSYCDTLSFYSTRDDKGRLFNVQCACVTIREFQKFLKRLRKRMDKYGISVRYCAKGEYGDALGRPHIHTVLYYYGQKMPNSFYEKMVCDSWYNAFKKYHGYPVQWNASYNRGKECCYNPIVEFDVITPGSVKYVAKYVVKDLTFQYSETAQYFPEFFTASRGLGVEIDEKQVEKIRSVLDAYRYRTVESITVDELPVIVKGLTYKFSYSEKAFFLPAHIKKYVCGGYYRYIPYDQDNPPYDADIKYYGFNKEFRCYDSVAPDKLELCQDRFDTFGVLRNAYNRLVACEWAKEYDFLSPRSVSADEWVYRDDLRFARLRSLISLHASQVMTACKNRIEGAEKALIVKLSKRKDYVEKKKCKGQTTGNKHPVSEVCPF